MQVFISKSGIVWSIIVLITCIFFLNGLSKQSKYSQATDLSRLDVANIQYGSYVTGEIHSLLKKGDMAVSGSFSSVGSGGDVYAIQISDNTYVRILVNNRETKALLEAACQGAATPIPFEGKIIKSPFSADINWYASIEHVNLSDISFDFVIQQVNPEHIKLQIYLSLEIFLICIILRIVGIVGKVITVEKKEESSNRDRFRNSYNLENELEYEKRQLERLLQWQVELRKDFLWSIPICMLGLIILIAPPYFLFKLPGIVLLLAAIHEAIEYFLNQPNKTSRFLAQLLNKKTLPERILECQNNIKKISSRIEDEQRVIIYDPLAPELEEYRLNTEK